MTLLGFLWYDRQLDARGALTLLSGPSQLLSSHLLSGVLSPEVHLAPAVLQLCALHFQFL